MASAVHDLPRCARRLHPRVALRADLATPAGLLSVYSTHTSRDDCQLRHLAELVGAHDGPLPTLLLGDLNTGETAPGLRVLLDRGFVDLYRAANPSAPGLTVWQAIEAPVPTVRRRVDYALMLPARDTTAEVVSSRVVLDTRGRGPDGQPLWPSDHYGVLAELRLRPAR